MSGTSKGWVTNPVSNVYLPACGSRVTLQSRNGSLSEATLPVRLSLGRYRWAASWLEAYVYVNRAADFNGVVYASRLVLLDNFLGTDGYVVWLDQIQNNGWNVVKMPLVEFGTLGHPNSSKIVGLSFWLYSNPHRSVSACLGKVIVEGN